jgi:hypothetical protein
MFVQVIEGQVSDPTQVHAALDRWAQDLAGDAAGWLGSTAGVTDDGTFVAVARFESEEAAASNSQRPEQDRWWSETAQLFTGEPTFRDSSEIDLDLQGEPDTARFVQVIEGRTSDPDKARELMSRDADTWASFRPDVLGSLSVNHGDGGYTAVLYFTSEAEAREGESKEPPAELKDQMAAMGELEVGEPTFLDLNDPWLYSPR